MPFSRGKVALTPSSEREWGAFVGESELPDMSEDPTAAEHRGKIVSANNFGLYIVFEPGSKREYVFTLDKVSKYDGGDPQSHGIALGREIQFSADHDQVVRVTALNAG